MAANNPFLTAVGSGAALNNPFAAAVAPSSAAADPFAAKKTAPPPIANPFLVDQPPKAPPPTSDPKSPLSPMTAAFGSPVRDTSFAFNPFLAQPPSAAAAVPPSTSTVSTQSMPAADPKPPPPPLLDPFATPAADFFTTATKPPSDKTDAPTKDAFTPTEASTRDEGSDTDDKPSEPRGLVDLSSGPVTLADPKLAKKMAKEQKKKQATLRKGEQDEAKRKAKEAKAAEKAATKGASDSPSAPTKKVSLFGTLRKGKSMKPRKTLSGASEADDDTTSTGKGSSDGNAAGEADGSAADTAVHESKTAAAVDGHAAMNDEDSVAASHDDAAKDGQDEAEKNDARSGTVSQPADHTPADASTLATPIGNDSIATDLALTQEQMAMYLDLWRAEAGDAELLGADKAVPLFKKSGLHPGVLESIWNIADTEEPLGELNFREFCVSLKLISLKQIDIAPVAENLKKQSPAADLVGDGTESAEAMMSQLSDYVNLPAPTAGALEDYTVGAIKEARVVPPGQEAVYERLWVECAGPDGGSAMAGACVAFFMTSKLPKKVLRHVWNIADHIEPLGQLGRIEFIIACKLIALEQHGRTAAPEHLYEHCPAPRMGSHADDVASSEQETAQEDFGFPMSVEEVRVYTELWGEVEKEPPGTHDTTAECASARAVASYLKTSGLPSKVLKHIWDLSDTGELGVMEKREFFVACKLISLVQAGDTSCAELDNMSNASPLPLLGSRARATPTATADASVDAAGHVVSPAVTVSDATTRAATHTATPTGGGGNENPFADLESANHLSNEVLRSKSFSVKNAKTMRRKPTRRTNTDRAGTLLRKQNFDRLQLTPQEDHVYTELWKQVAGADYADDASVSRASLRPFFATAKKLSPAAVDAIWLLADAVVRDELVREEFFVALKLIALAQDGHESTLAHLGMLTSMPIVGAPVTPLAKDETPGTAGADSGGPKPGFGNIFGGGIPMLPKKKSPASDNGGAGAAEGTQSSNAISSDKSISQAAMGGPKPGFGNLFAGGVPTLPKKKPAVAPPVEKKAAPSPPVKKKPAPAPPPKGIAKKLGLSSSDVEVYNKLWAAADTNGGFLAAGAAVTFLGTSGLPQKKLSKIWSMADTGEPRGQLDKDEFFVACKLVAMAQAGLSLDNGATAEVMPLPKFGASVGDDGSEELPHIAIRLALSKSDVAAYDKLWAEADTNSGYLNAGAAVKFLGTSGLAKQVLSDIWSMSDTGTPRGQLDKDEFFYACKLVAMAQAKIPLDESNMATVTPLPRVGSLRTGGTNNETASSESDLPHIATKLGLSASDVAAYDKLWAESDTSAGYMSAGVAVAFLGTSGLDKHVLRTIWDLSDTGAPRGQLDKDEFYVACKLVAMAQAGLPVDNGPSAQSTPLPKVGSLALVAIVNGADVGASGPTSKLGLSTADMAEYERLWAAADTSNGYLAAGAAVTFLGTSGLDKSVLRTIWSMADTDEPRGQLDKDEFFVACKLVAMAQAGTPLDAAHMSTPASLPKFT